MADMLQSNIRRTVYRDVMADSLAWLDVDWKENFIEFAGLYIFNFSKHFFEKFHIGSTIRSSTLYCSIHASR
jgi:hypothetical protein